MFFFTVSIELFLSNPSFFKKEYKSGFQNQTKGLPQICGNSPSCLPFNLALHSHHTHHADQAHHHYKTLTKQCVSVRAARDVREESVVGKVSVVRETKRLRTVLSARPMVKRRHRPHKFLECTLVAILAQLQGWERRAVLRCTT